LVHPGIIEKSAIEGQKTYHGDLQRAMRSYIQEHQTEFIPAGLDPATVAVAVAVQPPAVPESPTTGEFRTGPQSEEAARKEREKEREQERNQRELQWAYDTFEGAFAVGRQSATGAIELIRDAWDQSTTSTILYFVIAFLVLSNLWTLTLVGKREEGPPPPHGGAREVGQGDRHGAVGGVRGGAPAWCAASAVRRGLAAPRVRRACCACLRAGAKRSRSSRARWTRWSSACGLFGRVWRGWIK
jgi:hypothetical protein